MKFSLLSINILPGCLFNVPHFYILQRSRSVVRNASVNAILRLSLIPKEIMNENCNRDMNWPIGQKLPEEKNSYVKFFSIGV